MIECEKMSQMFINTFFKPPCWLSLTDIWGQKLKVEFKVCSFGAATAGTLYFSPSALRNSNYLVIALYQRELREDAKGAQTC